MLLVGEGGEISPSIIEKLRELGYDMIYIQEEGLDCESRSPVTEESWISSMTAIANYYDDTLKIMKHQIEYDKNPAQMLLQVDNSIRPPASDALRRAVRTLLYDLLQNEAPVKFESYRVCAKQNRVHVHVLNVTILSLMLGVQLELDDVEQEALGMGAVLHDVGKTAFPELFGKRYWEVTATERDLLRQHPILGQMLMYGDLNVTEAERQVIIQHHERQDGTGYPAGLKGENRLPAKGHASKMNMIFKLAEILAAANYYDNVVSGTLYNRNVSSVLSLEELTDEGGHNLNIEIVRMLRTLVAKYPIGSNVRVKRHPHDGLNGGLGVVTENGNGTDSGITIKILYDSEGKRIPAVEERLEFRSDEPVVVEALAI